MPANYHGNRIGVVQIDKVRKLRRNVTEPERILRSKLKNRQVAGEKFRFQHEFGPYILDFYCVEQRLAVEVDGSQHYEAAGLASDSARSKYLAAHGIRVLRFSNLEIRTELEGVIASIEVALSEKPSP